MFRERPALPSGLVAVIPTWLATAAKELCKNLPSRRSVSRACNPNLTTPYLAERWASPALTESNTPVLVAVVDDVQSVLLETVFQEASSHDLPPWDARRARSHPKKSDK